MNSWCTVLVFYCVVSSLSFSPSFVEFSSSSSAFSLSFFDLDNQKLTLTGVEVGGIYYGMILSLTDAESLLFTADSAATVTQPNSSLASLIADGVVSVPLLLADGERYSISLALHNEKPVQFRLTSAVKLTD